MFSILLFEKFEELTECIEIGNIWNRKRFQSKGEGGPDCAPKYRFQGSSNGLVSATSDDIVNSIKKGCVFEIAFCSGLFSNWNIVVLLTNYSAYSLYLHIKLKSIAKQTQQVAFEFECAVRKCCCYSM